MSQHWESLILEERKSKRKVPKETLSSFKKKQNLCLNVPRKKWMFWSHVRETDISKQDTWHLGKGVSGERDIGPDKRWLVPKAQVKTDFAAFSEFPRPSASFYFFIFGHSTWHVGSSSLSRDWTHTPRIGNTMDCSLSVSIHGILWARILEWVAMPSKSLSRIEQK